MRYQKIYDDLVSRAKDRKLPGYVERHHVVPRCMGGDNADLNIVELTPEEHFLAHKLLVKIYPDDWKLAFALLAMSRNPNGMRPNNKLFGWTRRRVATAISISRTGKKSPEGTGAKISAKLKGRKMTLDQRERLSAAHKGKRKLPEHLLAISAALKGRGLSGMTGRKHSPETIEKMRKAAFGRRHTLETKNRLKEFAASQPVTYHSERAKKAWETKRRKALEQAKPLG